jgi:hypothetical protein
MKTKKRGEYVPSKSKCLASLQAAVSCRCGVRTNADLRGSAPLQIVMLRVSVDMIHLVCRPLARRHVRPCERHGSRWQAWESVASGARALSRVVHCHPFDSSEPLSEKKSVFQAHSCALCDPAEVSNPPFSFLWASHLLLLLLPTADVPCAVSCRSRVS